MTGDQLLKHAKVYTLADKFGLVHLKNLASSKIHCVNSTAKGEIAYARYVYQFTPKEDTSIRVPVANFWATRSHTLRAEAEDEFRALCLEYPQFGYDVLSASFPLPLPVPPLIYHHPTDHRKNSPRPRREAQARAQRKNAPRRRAQQRAQAAQAQQQRCGVGRRSRRVMRKKKELGGNRDGMVDMDSTARRHTGRDIQQAVSFVLGGLAVPFLDLLWTRSCCFSWGLSIPGQGGRSWLRRVWGLLGFS